MTTDPGYPPLLAQGQTWEEMTVGSVRGEDVLIYTPVRLIRGKGYTEPSNA
jgi:hypothetical protein